MGRVTILFIYFFLKRELGRKIFPQPDLFRKESGQIIIPQYHSSGVSGHERSLAAEEWFPGGTQRGENQKQFSTESGVGLPHPLMAPEMVSLPQGSQGALKMQGTNVRVLNHDVLMGDEPVDAIVPAFPPVVGSPLVQQQGCPLLEGQLPGCPAHVVKLGNGLNGLTLCEEGEGRKHMLLGLTDSGN